MDDMNAFERQLASVVAGRARPVDAMAVVRQSTSTTSGRWSVTARRLRGSTTCPDEGGSRCSPHSSSSPPASSWRCSAASCSRASSPRRKGDEVAPAAVTESPSPMTTEELLSGMVTEEVEPGVFRVVNDGVRDLSYPVGGWGDPGFMVDVTPDGSVWLSGDAAGRACSASARSRCSRTPTASPPYREVAPDGSLWGLGEVPDDRSGIFSFDGEGWTVRATTTDGLDRVGRRTRRHGLGGGGGRGQALPRHRGWRLPRHRPPPARRRRLPHDHRGLGRCLRRRRDAGSNWRCHPTATYGSSARGLGHQRADLLLRFDGEGWEAIPGPEGWNPRASWAGTSTSVRTARCG